MVDQSLVSLLNVRLCTNVKVTTWCWIGTTTTYLIIHKRTITYNHKNSCYKTSYIYVIS